MTRLRTLLALLILLPAGGASAPPPPTTPSAPSAGRSEIPAALSTPPAPEVEPPIQPAPPEPWAVELGHRAARLLADRDAVVVATTDLTHYGENYGFVSRGRGAAALEWVRNKNDRSVIDTMLAMAPQEVINEALANQNACCAGAAATAIAAGKALGADQAQTIAYATSYDKSPGDSFVGYVGIVF